MRWARTTLTSAWAEGAALSTEEAIAYAKRGRGKRKRPTSGWASLTPTELDVVRLVSEGLGNNDVATRLFVSPRTVQTHLTHVYTKLGLTSRVQLVQEAARHMLGPRLAPPKNAGIHRFGGDDGKGCGQGEVALE